MSAAALQICLDAGVLGIRLSRPGKKNAISAAMYGEMTAALAAVPDSAHAVSITAEGPDFCAGNDLGDFLAAGEAGAGLRLEDSPAYAFVAALAACPLPVVAAVHGAAVGIGATLLV